MKRADLLAAKRNPPVLQTTLFLLAALVFCGQPALSAEPTATAASPPDPPAVPHSLLPETPDVDGFVSVDVGGYFSCDIPSDWSRIDGSGLGLTDEEKKTYGVELVAPEPGAVPLRIAVYYYAEGNLMYRSAEHYVGLFSQPALGVALEGSRYGEIRPATVAGREGSVFERVKSVPVSGTSSSGGSEKPGVYIRPGLNARWISVKERFVVLPAKSGFYALRYTAPEEKYEEFLPAFEKVTNRFYPGR